MKQIIALWKDERGAVTVDWVVLTAAAVAIAMIIYATFASPVSEMAEYIATTILEYQDYLN